MLLYLISFIFSSEDFSWLNTTIFSWINVEISHIYLFTVIILYDSSKILFYTTPTFSIHSGCLDLKFINNNQQYETLYWSEPLNHFRDKYYPYLGSNCLSLTRERGVESLRKLSAIIPVGQ